VTDRVLREEQLHIPLSDLVDLQGQKIGEVGIYITVVTLYRPGRQDRCPGSDKEPAGFFKGQSCQFLPLFTLDCPCGCFGFTFPIPLGRRIITGVRFADLLFLQGTVRLRYPFRMVIYPAES
jgi:hypothetical protein